MHVTCMEPVECTKGDGEAMYDYVRRERLERLHMEGKVLRRGGGRARARRAGVDGEGTAQGNHPEPQYKPQPQMKMENEHQMKDDVEAQKEVVKGNRLHK